MNKEPETSATPENHHENEKIIQNVTEEVLGNSLKRPDKIYFGICQNLFGLQHGVMGIVWLKNKETEEVKQINLGPIKRFLTKSGAAKYARALNHNEAIEEELINGIALGIAQASAQLAKGTN